MAARKRKKTEVDEHESPIEGGIAGIAGAVVLLAAVIVAGFFAWRQWGPSVVQRSSYELLVENVTTSEQPPWVAGDIRLEVFRDASLTEMSVLEDGLTKRICDAFEMHPWVARVNRVNMQPPAKIVVDLEYRQPIAWVEVPDGMVPGHRGGWLPIDKDSLLLPDEGFQQDPPELPLVRIDRLLPCGPIGTAWGDPRVAGAAAIVTILGDQWRELGIAGISGVADYSITSSLPTTRYELLSPKGKRIIWGAAPGKEPPSEPDAIQKLHLLGEFVRRHGPIDSAAQLGIDLRNAKSVLAPRTAAQPSTPVR
jgi:hypothetical protein